MATTPFRLGARIFGNSVVSIMSNKDVEPRQHDPAPKRRRKVLLALFFAAAHYFVLGNFILLSGDMIRGDRSAEGIRPTPIYGFLRVPENELTLETDAVDRLAADFGQIYFPSQELSHVEENYATGLHDPWNRDSRYAPLVHWACSVSLCRLSYGWASFLHMCAQMLVFFLVFVAAFRILKITSYLPAALLLTNVCLFVTPVGLSWFERGQFSLYVTSSYLLLLLGLIERRWAYVLLSAALAYVKWTTLVFALVVLVVFVASSESFAKLKANLRLAAIFPLTVAVLLLSYPSLVAPFVHGLMGQELMQRPTGLSLVKILPVAAVKAVPFVLMAVGYVYYRKKRDFLAIAPYLAGAGILLQTYPTIAYDYRIPCLFCFIPIMMRWAGSPEAAHPGHRRLVMYAFFAFLVVASFSSYINVYFRTDHAILRVYLVVSVLALLVPLRRI